MYIQPDCDVDDVPVGQIGKFFGALYLLWCVGRNRESGAEAHGQDAERAKARQSRTAMNPMSLYRLGVRMQRRNIPVLPKMCQSVIFVLFKAVVPIEAGIGPDTLIAHGGVGVVIHPRAVIGRNVLINSGVTIGGRSRRGAPIIGDNVYLATGCKVLGNVQVGSGSIVGANAVVIRDVPARSVVGGVPARILRSDIDVGDFEDLPRPVPRCQDKIL